MEQSPDVMETTLGKMQAHVAVVRRQKFLLDDCWSISAMAEQWFNTQ